MAIQSLSRGDIWLVQLDPTVGHEQSGRRPVLILSTNSFNQSPAELVIVAPLTSKSKNQPLHVPILPPEGGITVPSWIKTEDIRCISTTRFLSPSRWGCVSTKTLQEVELRLRRLLELK